MIEILPLINEILLLEKNMSSLSKILKRACVHQHMVIRDLEFCMPSLVKMDNGSILLNYWVFTTIFFQFLVQSALVAAKRAQLDKIVGPMREEKEEEPEGEVLGDESTGN